MYALTLRPSIAWNDSPEFVDVAYTLGIPHPPGSPTYVLLAKLGTFVPVGGVAARVNLFSALCTVLMLVLLVASLVRLHALCGGRATKGRIAGILCASLLALAPTVWNYATQAEVYACFTLMVALLLYLAIRWNETKDERFLLAGAFVFGASGGVHGTAIFFAPALVFLFLTNVPRGRMLRSLARAALFGLFGALIYLYLPLRATTEPAINWGHPDTFARFWSMISDRKDAFWHFPVASRPWGTCVKLFARNLHAELTAVGWIGALLGLSLLLRRACHLGVFTLLFCAGNLLFFILIWTIPDAYLPTFFVISFWNAVALAFLFERRSRLCITFAVSVCVAFLIAIIHQAQQGSVSAGLWANSDARSVMETDANALPQDSVVFVTATWFQLRYEQDVEGLRPDISVVLISDVTRPELFTPVSARRYPKLALPHGLDVLEKWEESFKGVLRLNLPRLPIFWEPIATLDSHVYMYLSPWRFFWRFSDVVRTETSVDEAQGYMNLLKRRVLQELDLDPDLRIGIPKGTSPVVSRDPNALKYHGYLLMASADVLRRQHRPSDALQLLELAYFLAPDDASVANALGKLFSGFGLWVEARRMFERAAFVMPDSPEPLVYMAALNTSLGRFKEARRSLDRALRVGPRAPEVYHEISVLETRLGRTQQAREALERALTLTSKERDRLIWQAELQLLSTGK